MKQKRILYFGIYQKDYPRNYLIIDALRENFFVDELNYDFFKQTKNIVGASKKEKIKFLFKGFFLLFLYILLTLKLILVQRRYDIIFTGYIGSLDNFVLSLLKRLKIIRKKVVANPLVSLYDTIVEDRGIIKCRFFSNLIIFFEEFSFKGVDLIIIDTYENKRYFIEKFNLDENKVKVVWVGADERFFYKKEREDENKNKDKVKVLFFGKYIPLHGIENIIKTIELLEEKKESFKFIFIGRGQLFEYFQKEFKKLKEKDFDLEIIEWVDYEKLNNYINSSDIVLGIFGVTPKAKRVIPNKVFQAVAVGKVVFTAKTKAILEFFKEDEIVLIDEPFPENLKKHFLGYLENKDFYKKIGEKGYLKFKKLASKEALSQMLKQILLEL